MLYTYHCQYCNSIILSEFDRKTDNRTCKQCKYKHKAVRRLKVTEGKVKWRWGSGTITKKENAAKLTDSYIKCVLRYNGIPHSLITAEMVKAQREILKAKRLIREFEDKTGITECRVCGSPLDKIKFKQTHKTLTYTCKSCTAKDSKRRYHERTGSETYLKTKGGSL